MYHERPERIAHSRSFVLIDLSESLTVAHLIWGVWAKERIPSPDSMRQSPIGCAYLPVGVGGGGAMLFWCAKKLQIYKQIYMKQSWFVVDWYTFGCLLFE